MPAVTICILPEEKNRALTSRAEHGHSTEAEMRAMLDAAVRPEARLRLGTAFSNLAGMLV